MAKDGCRAVKPLRLSGADWSERRVEMNHLARWQAYRRSVRWRMTADGIVTCRGPIRLKRREQYRVEMVPKAWRRYGGLIRAAAKKYKVPAELFVAVIVNESGLDPKSFQKYSGYISDRRTPDRISVGLGAVLISTARYMLKDKSIDRRWLQKPENAIRMIGVYLDRQYRLTGFDPPKVAAAYNAGSLYPENSRPNRWKLRNYPVGDSKYIDHFVAVFDETMRFLARRPDRPRQSFAALFAGEPLVAVRVAIPSSWTRRSVRKRASPMMMLTGSLVMIGDTPAENQRREPAISRLKKGRPDPDRQIANRYLQRLLD